MPPARLSVMRIVVCSVFSMVTLPFSLLPRSSTTRSATTATEHCHCHRGELGTAASRTTTATTASTTSSAATRVRHHRNRDHDDHRGELSTAASSTTTSATELQVRDHRVHDGHRDHADQCHRDHRERDPAPPPRPSSRSATTASTTTSAITAPPPRPRRARRCWATSNRSCCATRGGATQTRVLPREPQDRPGGAPRRGRRFDARPCACALRGAPAMRSATPPASSRIRRGPRRSARWPARRPGPRRARSARARGSISRWRSARSPPAANSPPCPAPPPRWPGLTCRRHAIRASAAPRAPAVARRRARVVLEMAGGPIWRAGR